MAYPRDSRGRSDFRSGERRQHTRQVELDPDVSQRLKEIESGGEPLSLAETISREDKSPNSNVVPDDDTPHQINVTTLQKMPVEELREYASEQSIDPGDLDKHGLIAAILKGKIKTQGIMFKFANSVYVTEPWYAGRFVRPKKTSVILRCFAWNPLTNPPQMTTHGVSTLTI